MKKIIRETDKERGILQVTIADERWYVRQVTDPATKLPVLKYVPSVTWIAGHYPKGIGFYKWLADKGWDESQAIKSAAGDKGSKVHEAISAILRGEEVRIDSKFVNPSTEQLEELTLEECDAIKSFVDWRKKMEEEWIVESIAWDVTVYSEQYNYGGSLDWIVRLTNRKTGEVRVTIVDFKTSAQVWSEYELQVSSRRHFKHCSFNGKPKKGMHMTELSEGIPMTEELYETLRDRMMHPQFSSLTFASQNKVRPREVSIALKAVSYLDYMESR